MLIESAQHSCRVGGKKSSTFTVIHMFHRSQSFMEISKEMHWSFARSFTVQPVSGIQQDLDILLDFIACR